MTVTKRHFVESLHSRLGLSRRDAEALVDSTLEIIKATLENGEDVLIRGFGKFIVKERNNRKGKNPFNAENLLLESKRMVIFRCSTTLRNNIGGK
jgi:integration host factor subunit alpha